MAVGSATTAERNIITVLAVDMVGSTRHIAGCDPDEAQAFLDQWLGHIRNSVERVGGQIVHYARDGGIAIHADRACIAWSRLVTAPAQCRQDRKKRAITAPANTHRVAVIISNSMRPKRRPLRSSPAERSVIALSSGPAKALQSFSPVKGEKVRGRLAPG